MGQSSIAKYRAVGFSKDRVLSVQVVGDRHRKKDAGILRIRAVAHTGFKVSAGVQGVVVRKASSFHRKA